jgi:uncharacterized membrane protein YbjE (DUF340 family)
MTVGLLSMFGVVVGLTLAFGSMYLDSCSVPSSSSSTLLLVELNAVDGSDIEREETSSCQILLNRWTSFSELGYDVGDLHYGVAGVNNKQMPLNTTLSEENKDAVQRYVCT